MTLNAASLPIEPLERSRRRLRRTRQLWGLDQLEGTVRVASIYSVGLSEMSHLKEEFGRRFPNARLEVENLRPDKVYEAAPHPRRIRWRGSR